MHTPRLGPDEGPLFFEREQSRRAALGHLGTGLAIGVCLLATSPVGAQKATPAASPAALPPLLQQMVEAINATDSAALAALYGEDGVHQDVPAGIVARGREEIAAFVDAALGQFQDVRFEARSGRQAGDVAVLEYDLSVVDPESGRPLTYRGVLVLELEGSLIRRSADYYDVAAILGLLGLLPAPEAAGTPVP